MELVAFDELEVVGVGPLALVFDGLLLLVVGIVAGAFLPAVKLYTTKEAASRIKRITISRRGALNNLLNLRFLLITVSAFYIWLFVFETVGLSILLSLYQRGGADARLVCRFPGR